jgi:ribosomal protein S27E
VSFALALGIVAAATCLAVVLAGPVMRVRCPRCAGRRLAHLAGHAHEPLSLFARYRCGGCGAHWVACGRGLVSREAFAAGARDPFPVATLRRP